MSNLSRTSARIAFTTVGGYSRAQDFPSRAGPNSLIDALDEIGRILAIDGQSDLARDTLDKAIKRAHAIVESACTAADEHKRPSALYRPTVRMDGKKWCALYGSNIMEGVCGFGDSPEEAMADFDANWVKK